MSLTMAETQNATIKCAGSLDYIKEEKNKNGELTHYSLFLNMLGSYGHFTLPKAKFDELGARTLLKGQEVRIEATSVFQPKISQYKRADGSSGQITNHSLKRPRIENIKTV